jgi:site-specific recombinase XerD
MLCFFRSVTGDEGCMDPSKIRIRGPLASHVDGLWRELAAQGYAPLSIANMARVMAHLSQWLEREHLGPSGLSAKQNERFLLHRRRAGYTCWRSTRGLEPILGYLRGVGVVPPIETPYSPKAAIDVVVEPYMAYIREERAVSPSTASVYERLARAFLSRRADTGAQCAADVSTFVLKEARTCSIGFAKLKISALRSLLRHLYVHGDIAVDLAASVPAVAGWRLATLPKALRPDEVKQLLRGCDRRTHGGRRTFAVVLLMVRLGLRAGEVAGLELDDIDWAHGELLVRGKGRRLDRLPLPADVGAALAAYVRRSRPRTECRRLLMRVRAPLDGLSRGSVTAIVRAACARAGLATVGAHRLRHTAATEMLRHGASLSDIAQVLRHRHVDTTAIYAKVDRVSLRTLAQPWPGGAS